MAYAIAAVRTAVLALLDDVSSARFTSAQIDQAARTALVDYDSYRPVVSTAALTGTGARLLSLPSTFITDHISRLVLVNANPDLSIDLPFYASKINGVWVVDTITAYPLNTAFLVYYEARNTINGLDSATATTADNDNLLCVGVAGYTAQMRSVSRAESINMQPSVAAQLTSIAEKYLATFLEGLKRYRPTEEIINFAPPVFGDNDATQFRAAARALLGDDQGKIYLNNQLDTAMRAALMDYDLYNPLVSTLTILSDGYRTIAISPTITEDGEIIIYDDDGNRVTVAATVTTDAFTRLVLVNANPDLSTDIPFLVTKVEGVWIIDTITTYPLGTKFLVYFKNRNTIDGLDSAVTTTVDNGNLFAFGVASYAAQTRALTESVPAVAQKLAATAIRFATTYVNGLRARPPEASYYPLTMPEVRF
jgi:hypothetical protein